MSNNDLISREALKEAIRKRLCISSLKYLTEQEKVIVEEIDNASTIARTDKPLAIINDKVIYMTDGHVNALLEYEHKQAVQIAIDNLKRDIVEVQLWENEHGKK